MTATTTRLFEYQDEKSAKFWEVTAAGSTVTVRYGKLGTTGQSQTKELADAAAAAQHVAKLIAEKTGKGYVESGGAATAAIPAPAPSVEAPDTEPAAAAPRQKSSSSMKAAPKNPAKDPEASPESLLPLLDQDDATNRLLARHPNASAELLEKLSHSSDQATRKAVCLNPNADKDVLLRLAPQFPGDFFRNPVFDWLLLEDPDLLFKLGQGVLKNILKRPDCPQSFLQWAASHGSEQEQLAVAMNPNAPAELIEILATKPGAVADAARGRLQPDTVVPVDLEQAFRDEVGKALAEMTIDEFKSAKKRGLIGVAQWPALSFEFRAAMLDLDPAVIAHGLLPEAIPTMAAHEIDAIRTVVAGYQATPAAILSHLALDKVSEVRAAVARNPACPVDSMAQLAADWDSDVKKALAGNPNISHSLISILANDHSYGVPQAVTKSTIVTKDQLESMAQTNGPWSDERYYSEKLIRSRLNAPETDPETPAEQLAELALSKKAGVRCAVAANPSTPEATLRELAAKANLAIWQALSRNPRAPSDLYERAYLQCIDAADDTGKLRSVFSDPDCPPVAKQLVAAKLWKSSLQNCDQLVHPKEQRTTLRALQKSLKKLDDKALLPAFRQDCIAMLEHPAESRLGRTSSLLAVDSVELDSDQASVFFSSKTRAIRLVSLAHRQASPDLLARRSKSTDWVERLAIARNPSTPPNILAGLKLDPHALVARQAQVTEQVKAQDRVRQNEIVATTTDTANLTPFVETIRQQLRESCRPWQVAGTRWWSQLTVAQRLGAANPELLLKWPLSQVLMDRAKVEWVRCAVASSPRDKHPCLGLIQGKWKWAGYVQDEDEEVLYKVAENPRTSWPMLEVLAQHKDELVRSGVAKNPQTPISLLEKLAKQKQDSVRSAVASNPATPLPLLERLAKDRKAEVRRAVAWNPQTPLPLQEKLAQDKGESVHGMLAENANIPLPLLEKMAQDQKERVRGEVAKNPQTPLSLLERLAQDKSDEVRDNVAWNEQTPLPLLEILAQDNSDVVRRRVAWNKKTPMLLLEKLAKDKVEEVRQAVASNLQITMPLLEMLAKDPGTSVRADVAANPNTSWELLARLSADKKEAVASLCTLADQNRRYVEHMQRTAEDPATAPEQLLELARDGLWAIRWAALNNPSLPTSVRDAGMESLRSEIEEALRANDTPSPPTDVAQQEFAAALLALDLMPSPTDKKAVAAAAKSKDVLARIGAILTPGIQPSLLRMLLDDEVETVRQLAASKLRELEASQ